MSKLLLFPFVIISFFAVAQDEALARINLHCKYKPDSEYIQKSIEFINQVMGEEINKSSFILDDLPFSFSDFCRDGFRSNADTNIFAQDKIIFIAKEWYQSLSNWSKEMFPHVKIVSHDTIVNIFKNKVDGWKYFRQNIGTSLHSFSFPVFLKNYTYCVFAFDLWL